MSISIGAYEAKTNLSALLERVARGESLTITRNGKPVARLVPAEPTLPAHAERLSDRLRSLRDGLRAEGVAPFSPAEIRDLIDSGRKY